MKTRINISGEYKTYDLDRYRYISQVRFNDKVVVIHPETEKLCVARVVILDDKWIMVREVYNSDAPHQWRIYKGSLFRGVFKIN